MEKRISERFEATDLTGPQEVVDIMMALFDQEKAMKDYIREISVEKEREGLEKGIEKGLEEGMEKGKIEVALNMKKKGYSEATIADILEVGLNVVQQWLLDVTTAK